MVVFIAIFKYLCWINWFCYRLILEGVVGKIEVKFLEFPTSFVGVDSPLLR